MIIIRNDTTTSIHIIFKNEEICIEPGKVVEISTGDFRYLLIPDRLVKIRNGVIKIK